MMRIIQWVAVSVVCGAAVMSGSAWGEIPPSQGQAGGSPAVTGPQPPAVPPSPDYIIRKDGVREPVSGKSLVAIINDRRDEFASSPVVELSGTITGEAESQPDSGRIDYDFSDGYKNSVPITLRVLRDQTSQIRVGKHADFQAVVGYENNQPVLTFVKLVTTEPPWLWILIGAAAVVLVLIIVLLVFLMRREPQGGTLTLPEGKPMGVTGTRAGTASGSMLDTTKVEHEVILSSRRPSIVMQPDKDSATTVKMMPGYLDVLGGTAKGKRLYIYSAETTIGRGPAPDGRRLGHIGFDPEDRAVSRSQAKLRYDPSAKRFRLINLVDPKDKNATVLNGREMNADEAAELNNGDKVRFGEIELEFHSMQPTG